MSTDYEIWARRRKPLPDWWLEAGGRDPSYPLWRGIRFVLRQGEAASMREWICVVRREVFDLLAKARLSDAQLLQGWAEHEGKFALAAKQKILARRPAPGRRITIELADLNWD